MDHLRVSLLGQPSIHLNDQSLHDRMPIKACAMLYYLVATGRAHHRSHLAGLLWGEMSEQRARNNLSIVRTGWKKFGVLPFLRLNKREIGISAEISSDLQSLADATQPPINKPLDALRATAALYRGDFLANLTFDDPEQTFLFDEWLLPQRERWRQATVDLYRHIADEELALNDNAAALTSLRQLLGIDPTSEQAHRDVMRLLAVRGQRDQAIAQFKQCEHQLAYELGLTPSRATEQLYADIVEGKFNERQVPAVVQQAKPFQAPSLPAHFAGRDAEIEQVVASAASNTPVTAVVGMGGVGKSTLAAAAAHRLREQYVDGVLWAHAKQQDMAGVLLSWAAALGVDLSHLTLVENRAAALRTLLGQRKVLLVLDGVTEAAEIRPILPPNNNSHLLLTTRSHDVAHALGATTVALDVLSDGMPILRSIVGVERVDAEADEAVAMCALLEQLPLALEIAAQRLKARPRQTLASLMVQLQQARSRLDTLTISDRAVRSSFAVSWDGLNQSQRAAFAGLSVFEGRDLAVSGLADVVVHDTISAETLLEDLVALSLLTPAHHGRYRQHALLADYSREQSISAEQWNTHRDRMVAHYAALVAETTTWSQLEPEWENLQAAIRHAHSRQNWDGALDLTLALGDTYFEQAKYKAAQPAFALAESAAINANRPDGKSKILFLWGKSNLEQADYDAGYARLTESLDWSRDEDDFLASETMLQLARVAQERSENEEVHQWLMESQAKKRQLNDTVGLGKVENRMARLTRRTGDLNSAEVHATKAIQYFSDEDIGLTARAYLQLASISIQRRLYSLGLEHSQKVLQLAEECNDRDLQSSALYMLLVCNVRLTNLSAARTYAERCNDIFAKMGAVKHQGLIHHELSIAAANVDDYQLSLHESAQAEGVFRKLESSYELVTVLIQRAKALIKMQRWDEADIALVDARELALPIRHHQMPELIQLESELQAMA